MSKALRRLFTKYNDLTLLASFPGETWDEEAVYVRREGQPAFVLVREAWGHEAVAEALTRLGPRLAPLAEQWGCPVAGMIAVRPWLAEASVGAVLERAGAHTILVACTTATGRRRFSLPQGRLTWHEPSLPASTVALPPFPQRWWPVLGDLEPLLQELAAAAPGRRRQTAAALAARARHRLTYTPALMLLRGEATVAEVTHLLPRLLPQLEPIAGRRYVLWSLLYLGASLCFAPHFQGRAWACLRELLDGLAQRWAHWTTKEQRVIIRGLGLLAHKGAEAGLAGAHPLWAELRGWAYSFLEPPRLPTGWRCSSRVQEFLLTLADLGVLPAGEVSTLLRQHQERGRLLEVMVWGVASAFWDEPSVARWQQVEPLFSRFPEAADQLQRCLRFRLEEGPTPEFWRFVEALRQHGGLLYGRWLQCFLKAIEGLEPGRLAPGTWPELAAFLEQELASEGTPTWLQEPIRRLLEAHVAS